MKLATLFPTGSGRSNDKGGYRRSNAYSMDMLRDQQNTEEEMEATQRLSIVVSFQLLISTHYSLFCARRTNVVDDDGARGDTLIVWFRVEDLS